MAKRRNPAESPEQLFRSLVMDSDPNAMKVAEDVLLANGLSLVEIGNQWEREAHKLSRWDAAPASPTSAGMVSRGVFLLSDERVALPTWIGWNVHRFGGGKHEIELVYMLWGRRLDPNTRSAYTAAIGHVTYYETFEAARRQAAADCWAVAKVLKRIAAYEPGDLDGDNGRQQLIDALFASDKTAPAVYGGRRDKKKWSNYERPTGGRRLKAPKSNPAKESLGDIVASRLAELGADAIVANPAPGNESFPPNDMIVCEKCRAVLHSVGWEDGLEIWANEDNSTRCVPKGRHSAINAWHVAHAWRKNPGELDRVKRHFETEILDGAEEVLDKQLMTHLALHSYADKPPQTRTAARRLLAAIAKAEEVDSVVDLFALAMQIDTGEEFEFVMPVGRPRVRPELILDSARGQYIPQGFAERIDHQYLEGLSYPDYQILERGPDWDEEVEEAYWEVWSDVLDNVTMTDPSGVKWWFSQTENGDVFMVPVGMVETENGNERWEWEKDTDSLAREFGEALAHMALLQNRGSDVGVPWFANHKQESDDGRMRWEPAIPRLESYFQNGEFHWKIGEVITPVHRVRVSYERIIPSDEEDGEHEVETGWEDDDGVVIETDDDVTIAEATALMLQRHGSVEASSSTFHPGVWYSEIDSVQDRDYFERGIEYRRSFHLSGYTPDEEREVYDLLKKRNR